MNTDYLILLGLYLLSQVIRTSYELFKKAGRVNPKNTMVFAVILVVMCLMWATWFGMCPLDPLRLAFPEGARWIGLGVLIAGLGLSIGALIQLRGMENINHLVTTGLFSRIRHPMYAGFILWIFGWAIIPPVDLVLILLPQQARIGMGRRIPDGEEERAFAGPGISCSR